MTALPPGTAPIKAEFVSSAIRMPVTRASAERCGFQVPDLQRRGQTAR